MAITTGKSPTKRKNLVRNLTSETAATSTEKTPPHSSTGQFVVIYNSNVGIDAYIRVMHDATPLEMVEMERLGVPGAFITDLSKRMDIPSKRIYEVLRIPPATAARKSNQGANVDGRAGLAAIGMIKLISLAQEIVDDSTADEAKEFDVVRWLGQWIEQPQPALGGSKPSEYLDTPTGVELVCKVLGAMRSGAYL